MTKTAKELFNRFTNERFYDIDITMKADGTVFRLHPIKADESKSFEPDNMVVQVYNQTGTFAVGGLENIAGWLCSYKRGFAVKTPPVSGIDGDIHGIMTHTLIDFDRFEPVDSQGCALEGIAEFNNEEFCVALRGMTGQPYIVQAAEQIMEELRTR